MRQKIGWIALIVGIGGYALMRGGTKLASDQVPAGGGGGTAPLTATATNIDLPSLASTCDSSDRTITVSGAQLGNMAYIVPPTANDLRMTYPAKVSALDTVSWRACSIGATVDQANGNYTAYVIQP